MMLLGSRALNYWDKSYKVDDKTDWDILGLPDQVEEWADQHPEARVVEAMGLDKLNNGLIPNLFSSGHTYKGLEVCSIPGLVLMKRSHLWRNLKFDRHITQYHKHLIPLMSGYVLSYEQMFWFMERVNLTKEEYPQGNPSLMQSNEDFFDDFVVKKYDHDYLHELYAYDHRPMYTRLKRKDKEDLAWCEEDLWDQLEPWEKNLTVAEEAYVIATERFLVPSDWSHPYKFAYLKAVNKICTTLTSGWFRDWAIDNYPTIINLFDADKIDNVKEKLENANHSWKETA